MNIKTHLENRLNRLKSGDKLNFLTMQGFSLADGSANKFFHACGAVILLNGNEVKVLNGVK